MGISHILLDGLRVFEPNSILDNNLDLFEVLKFETSDLRDNDTMSKEDLVSRWLSRSQKVRPKKPLPQKRSELKNTVNKFVTKITKTSMAKEDENEIIDLKWSEIDEFCNILRNAEKSDERKIRWALYYLIRQGKSKISIEDLGSALKEFKISNILKHVEKIIKKEVHSGLDCTFDKKNILLNHDPLDKIIWHYFADDIEESSRRSPGKIEEEILELFEEGSYSNSELAEILQIDEASISRTLSKLKQKDKITLSSFGHKGIRFYTTNCDNCPFGTTKSACRKESLAHIINAFNNDYQINLNANDFEMVQTNQALLKIKKIIRVARKEKNTTLEQNISESLEGLLGAIVEKSLKVKITENSKIPSKINLEFSEILTKLPMLYHLGLYQGAKTNLELINELLKISKIPKEERLQIKKIVRGQTYKFLGFAGIKSTK